MLEMKINCINAFLMALYEFLGLLLSLRSLLPFRNNFRLQIKVKFCNTKLMKSSIHKLFLIHFRHFINKIIKYDNIEGHIDFCLGFTTEF